MNELELQSEEKSLLIKECLFESLKDPQNSSSLGFLYGYAEENLNRLMDALQTTNENKSSPKNLKRLADYTWEIPQLYNNLAPQKKRNQKILEVVELHLEGFMTAENFILREDFGWVDSMLQYEKEIRIH